MWAYVWQSVGNEIFGDLNEVSEERSSLSSRFKLQRELYSRSEIVGALEQLKLYLILEKVFPLWPWTVQAGFPALRIFSLTTHSHTLPLPPERFTLNL